LDATSESPDAALELRQYVQQKQAIGQAIRELQEVLKYYRSQTLCDECHELMVKLAEDRFTLAVVGQFKRGKSSLMNTIVGRELLPTGLLPLTSVVTIVRFGTQERILVPCEGFPYEREFPVSALREYVTEEGNPGNQRQIKTVYVETASPFLRRGLEFVDTPGIGSAIIANTETTYGFLPQCDAVLFVTSMDSPLTSAEIDFLRDLRRYIRKVFFVVNKSDLLEDPERSQVLAFVRGVLRRAMGKNDVRVFPVSARAGLAAKVGGNQQELGAAGIVELETALAEFLASERAVTFLVAIVDQAARLLEAERDGVNQNESDDSSADGISKTHRMTQAEQQARCAGLLRRLELIRAGILSGTVPEAPVETPLVDPVDVAAAPSQKQVEPDAKLLATRGSPVCDYVAQSLFNFYCQFQYRLNAEESTQKCFAEELGFCPLHTWHLSSISSPLGISAGYPALIRRLATELSALAIEARGSQAAVARLLVRPENCRACQAARDSEQIYIQRMAELLQGSAYREQYAQSQGVCLRHLAMLLEASPRQEIVHFLLTESAHHFQEVAEDMLSFVIKWEARRRALMHQDEQDAYVRALTHLVGHRYMATAVPPDAEF
jgi:GTP-binding protein EngB required for normal cell division